MTFFVYYNAIKSQKYILFYQGFLNSPVHAAAQLLKVLFGLAKQLHRSFRCSTLSLTSPA